MDKVEIKVEQLLQGVLSVIAGNLSCTDVASYNIIIGSKISFPRNMLTGILVTSMTSV